MKILQFITNLTSGGAEKLVYDISLKLKEKDHEVEVLVLFDKNNFYIEDLKERGINVISLSYNSRYNILNFFKIFKILRKNRYDIVHTHLFPALYFSGIISMFFNKIKFIYTEHSTNNKRRNKICLKIIEKIIYSKFKKIICISKGTEEMLRKHLDNKTNRIIQINNGIDMKNYFQARSISRQTINIEIKDDDILLIMVGRFTKAKDQNTVIKAMRLLPEKYKLILVGEGALILKSKALVNELKLEKKVFFLGERKDVPDLLKTSDISILSSNWEGFGLVVIESLAVGTPVLVSNIDTLKNIVEDKSFIFECGDEVDLARKIIALSKNKKRLNVDLQEYELDNMVNRYLEVYTEKKKG